MTHTRRWRHCLAVSAAILLSVLIAAPLVHANDQPTAEHDLLVFGLTRSGHLVHAHVGSPDKTKEVGRIKGLVHPDTALIGIDFRVQDGLLYGVGNGGGVYTIDTHNAHAALVNSLTSRLWEPFGVDFNPAADRLGSSATPARISGTM